MLRSVLLLIVVALLLVGIGSSPSFAVSEPAAEGGTADHGTHGKKGEERGIFPRVLDLGIWTLVIFLILLFVLSKFAWKPMLHGLAERERNIAQAHEEAEKAKAGAAALQHQLETERLKAAAEIREKFEEARKRAEELADEFRSQARAEIAADRERLHREVETSKTQALHEVWTQTAQLATLSATKILKREINPDDQKQLVDEALVEFRRSLSERQQQMTGLQA